MTFEDWWSEFYKKQGGGYHWQTELAEMKDSFKEAYDCGVHKRNVMRNEEDYND